MLVITLDDNKKQKCKFCWYSFVWASCSNCWNKYWSKENEVLYWYSKRNLLKESETRKAILRNIKLQEVRSSTKWRLDDIISATPNDNKKERVINFPHKWRSIKIFNEQCSKNRKLSWLIIEMDWVKIDIKIQKYKKASNYKNRKKRFIGLKYDIEFSFTLISNSEESKQKKEIEHFLNDYIVHNYSN